MGWLLRESSIAGRNIFLTKRARIGHFCDLFGDVWPAQASICCMIELEADWDVGSSPQQGLWLAGYRDRGLGSEAITPRICSESAIYSF